LDSGSIDAAMLVAAFNKLATEKRGFHEILSFNEIMNIPLGGLRVSRTLNDIKRKRRGEMPKMIERPQNVATFVCPMVSMMETIALRYDESDIQMVII